MKTFTAQFQEIVKQKGNETALVYKERQVTYGELDILSGKIAACLLEHGAKKEKIYPIVLPRGIEYIAAEIGILKAGAAFSPLSVEYPKDRVDYIKKDCRCDFIVDQAFIAQAQRHAPLEAPAEVAWRDAAMVIYTSGSTGNPKGIVHEHYSFTRAIIRQLPVGCKPGGVEMSVTPFNFAISVADIFVPLWVGTPIHILSEDDRKDIIKVDGYIDAHGITASVISPQLLKRLPDRESSLKNICCGGERISGIYQRHNTIYNSYGLSETLSIAIAFPLDRAYDNTPIGFPLEDFTVYLLDSEGNRVKDGEEGEICIAGPLARGYINLPEQTAKTFVDNPYATGKHDKRMLHTNDMGKRLPDGSILYINRKDWMVKINGQRVEIGEVEIQLGKLDGIETAVVKSFEDQSGQTYLCGYYQCAKPVTESEVRLALSQKFPGYMIPRFLVQVERFPLNANGKLDRKALTPPEASSFQAKYTAPETPRQTQVCDGFAKVLGVKQVGLDDDFFSMGGDSIKVVILQEELSSLNLSSSAIFEGRTPRNIAKAVPQAEGPRYEDFRIQRDCYPMTDSQLGIYLECARQPESLMYNNVSSFLFPKEMQISAQALKNALVTVIESYPFMKIHVEHRQGVPHIIPNSGLRYDIPIKPLQSADIETAAKAFAAPFPLEKGPLFRFAVFTLPDGGVLLLGDMHHLITDGASTSLFYNRMARVYQGKELEAEQVDSFMLSNYETALKETPEYIKSKEFFDNMLGGVETDSNLIPDEPSSLSGEQGNRVLRLSLGGDIPIDELRKKAKKLGVTESTLFLSAFSYALAKQNGQDEALFCTVNNGRHTPDLRNTMGMLVRTLPLYIRIDEEQQPQAFMQQAQSLLYDCMKHDAYSFVQTAAEHGIKSDIIFVYQGDTLNGVTLNGRFIPMQLHKGTDSMANLSLDVLKQEADYTLMFEYRGDLYSEQTVKQFAALMISVLRGLLSCAHLKDIPLCSGEDLAAYHKFNENTVHFDQSLTMASLFCRQAKETPERTAVIYKDKSLTYRQLDELSSRLAGALADAGVKPEVPVGILVNRSEIFPVCTFGICKAGGVCQPLDSNYPKERLEYMLEDSGAPVIVMDEELKGVLPDYKGTVLYTKDIACMQPRPDALHAPSAGNLFALLYTSGSTGKPKGCMIEHKNLVNFCLSFQERFHVTCEDRASAYGSFGFDASMQDLYPYLTRGACVCIVPEETRLDLPGLHTFLMENKITMMDCTTQLGRQYVCAYRDNPYLRALTVGGEKLVPCTPPEYPFVNTYGPTECSIYVTDFVIGRDYNSVPIGKPFGNCDIYITDQHQRLLPPGVPGELCIAGYPVTRGYLNRPDLTAEKFVPNPWNSAPGYERMYRTGDICRYLPDGNIQFVGRRDEQVKIRGFRIELTEIERRIRAFDGIKDASVIARDLPAGGKTVVAYVVSDEPVGVTALNEFIAQELPRYMVPSVTMQIDSIPLNPNGKVDKRRLPQPKAAAQKQAAGARPLNLLEKEIKEMICGITGQEDLDPALSLMSAGLSSLSMIILASRISERFGCRLNVPALMEEDSTLLTVENAVLKSLMEQQPGQTGAQQKPDAAPVKELPLSSAQLGVCYDCMKRPGALLYNIPMMFTFDKKTDPRMLARAAGQVVAAHPALSVHLVEKDEEIMQVTGENTAPEIPVTECAEEELAAKKARFAQPFDLFTGPLYRISVVQTEKRVALLMDVHHIIFDGLSMSAFLEEIKTAYETGAPSGELYSFFDAVREENAYLLSSEGKQSEAYYDSLFGQFESAGDIPADKTGRPEDGKLGECEAFVDQSLLDGFCKEHGLTPATVFLASTCYTACRYTAGHQTYLSMICSGREDGRFRDSFGMFVKTLPLFSAFSRGETTLSYIKRTGKEMRTAISHSAYPFVKRAGRYGYTPQINYACQLGVDGAVTLEGSPVTEEVLTNPLPKFHISVHIETKNGAPAVCIQYNDALYSAPYMQGLADALAACATHMMQAPQADIAAVSLLGPGQQTMLGRFGLGETAAPREQLFHRAFERQVSLVPGRTALIACDASYTYAQLDRQVNRLANALIQLGAAPGERIAILLPRTSRLIIAMYGVLKAGAVFIPCDPDYPEDRVRYILSDSNAKYIITDKGHMGAFPQGQALDADELLLHPDDTRPDVSVGPQDLAYLIYTSGSTGRPKGVMLTHGGIANYVDCHPANVHVHAAAQAHTMVSVTTVSFDMSFKETAVTLCNGLTLVLADESQAKDPHALAKLFEKTDGDIFGTTPSRMEQYLELPAFCHALSRCKVIMCGGEKYPETLLSRLRPLTNARIFNTYGPTEITVSCNAKELTDQTQVTIGKPLLNVREFIVDCDENLLPVGVTGELYVGGAGVARGYWNNQALTQKQFIQYSGMRVYKTGDYAKWTHGGDVVILGRTDSQLKLRGLRIEPGEIEKCILSDPRIKQAAVLVRKLGPAEHLCAYFTAAEEIEPGKLKERLSQTLTSYMVPTAYLQVQAMPVTPNGKIDRKKLPDPAPVKGGANEAPANDTERAFCRIFADILQLESVGATDSFFDLGGTSLTVTSVLIKANEQGFPVSYGDVFAQKTPRGLAGLLNAHGTPCGEEDQYDYSRFDKLLSGNTLGAFRQGEKRELGSVLLTGATGFLGVHILHEFLEKEQGEIYCLLRSLGNMSAKTRLQAKLFYYFENNYEELFGTRIHVVEGNVTETGWTAALSGKPVGTVINCAALVKHFSSNTDIEDVNVGGVANLIAYCRQSGACLVQISTGSVAGDRVDNVPPKEIHLTEQSFYFGQNIDNQYVHSKFMAERLVLEAAAQGLDAKIMRVGNLAARENDGEFQVNFTTNGFMGRLKAYLAVGAFPYSAMNTMVEMAPVDSTAKAILLLAKTPKECCVFHPYNNHYVPLGDIILQMRRMGMQIALTEDAEFEQALKQAKQDPVKARLLTTLLAYENMDESKKVEMVGTDNGYTTQLLYRMGFAWSMTSRAYMDQFLDAIDGLGFFELDQPQEERHV